MASAALLAFAARPGVPSSAALPLGALVVVATLARREGGPIWRAWSRRFAAAILPIALAIVVLNGLFYPDGRTVLVRVGPAAVSAEGLAFAAVVITRLSLIIGAVVLAAVTTRAEDLAAWLLAAGVPHPLPAFVPVAGGLLPDLRRRAADIAEAQRARGLVLRRGRMPSAGAVLALAVPLLGAVLEDVEARTRALEARGIGLAGPRSSLAAPADEARQRLGRRVLLVAAAAVLVAARWPR